MDVWETREVGFEKSQEMDASRRFKTLARRNRLIGLWAAEKLGLGDAAAQTYAAALVEAQVGQDDDEALAVWLDRQLAGVNPAQSQHRIRRRIAELDAKAAKDIFEGR